MLVSSCCRPKYVNLFEWLQGTIGKMALVFREPPFCPPALPLTVIEQYGPEALKKHSYTLDLKQSCCLFMKGNSYSIANPMEITVRAHSWKNRHM